MSDKVKPHHLERKAILYIRQSSAYQVSHNLESQKLQYAMQERLQQLSWREIEVVDEDLGRSAAGTVTRAGFERMVAEVCLGKVGAVAAREVSRFARNRREWQQLVEVCRIVDTLLVDQETVYSPRQSNDRLLLGLKGSLNEYELDLLRQRSLEARREKARRGELLVTPAVGYVKTEEQHWEKDPDRRVQQAVLVDRRLAGHRRLRSAPGRHFSRGGEKNPSAPVDGRVILGSCGFARCDWHRGPISQRHGNNDGDRFPIASPLVHPNILSAPIFQLVMMPSRFLLTMASSEDSTMAASDGTGHTCGHAFLLGSTIKSGMPPVDPPTPANHFAQ
jgi:DNA invertase Pin-like site-specific DNA recombinase